MTAAITSRVSTSRNRPFPDAATLSLDVETTGLSPHTDDIVCIAVSDGVDGIVFDVRPPAIEPGGTYDPLAIGNWLTNDIFDRSLILHNASFDLAFLRQKYGVDFPANVFDTMLAEQLLTAGYLKEEEDDADDEGNKHTASLSCSLKATAERRLGLTFDKTLQTSFTIDGAISREQADYALSDVIPLHAIANRQQQKLTAEKLDIVWDIERRAQPVFAEMTRVGIAVDLNLLVPLLEANRAQRDALLADLQAKLSPHVLWQRIAKRDATQSKLDQWNDAYAAQTAQLDAVWTKFAGALSPDQPGLQPPRDWIEHNWHDRTIDTKDGKPKGQKRYVRAQLKDWRVTHQRPVSPKLDESPINLNSPPQVLAACRGLGIELPNLQTKTIQAALADANPQIRDDILVPLLAYKKAEKLDSAFGDTLIARVSDDGRLRAQVRQIGSATGRPAMSKPNLLQIPADDKRLPLDKSMRRVFRAGEGKRMIVADYSQMELRIIAQASGDRNMRGAFERGLDLHTYTASLMFGAERDNVTDKQRKVGKTISFGIAYGMGPNKLRYTLAADGIFYSAFEARDALQRWRNAYPQAARWIQKQGEHALAFGYTATPLGRRRRFDPSAAADEGARGAIRRQGANHCIQGANADITKLAMTLIHESLSGRGTILLNVYDEIVTEVDEEVADAALHLVRDAMTAAARVILTDVPVAVDAVISRSWSEHDGV